MEFVGTFQAKTHFARLVREAEEGKNFIITRKGKPVAQLGPLSLASSTPQAAQAADRILARNVSLGMSIREALAEGRR